MSTLFNYKGPERRKCRRESKLIAVNIVKCGNKNTLPKLNEEIGLNIALGGMLIECSKRLPIGTRLKLKIMLAYDSKYIIIQTPAKIIWTKRSFRKTYFFGCKFLRLSPRQKSTLRKFII